MENSFCVIQKWHPRREIRHYIHKKKNWMGMGSLPVCVQERESCSWNRELEEVKIITPITKAAQAHSCYRWGTSEGEEQKCLKTSKLLTQFRVPSSWLSGICVYMWLCVQLFVCVQEGSIKCLSCSGNTTVQTLNMHSYELQYYRGRHAETERQSLLFRVLCGPA